MLTKRILYLSIQQGSKSDWPEPSHMCGSQNFKPFCRACRMPTNFQSVRCPTRSLEHFQHWREGRVCRVLSYAVHPKPEIADGPESPTSRANLGFVRRVFINSEHWMEKGHLLLHLLRHLRLCCSLLLHHHHLYFVGFSICKHSFAH